MSVTNYLLNSGSSVLSNYSSGVLHSSELLDRLAGAVGTHFRNPIPRKKFTYILNGIISNFNYFPIKFRENLQILITKQLINDDKRRKLHIHLIPLSRSSNLAKTQKKWLVPKPGCVFRDNFMTLMEKYCGQSTVQVEKGYMLPSTAKAPYA